MIETIGELIIELQKYPPNTKIFDLYDDPFEEVEYCDKIYIGDPPNPKSKVTKGYRLV